MSNTYYGKYRAQVVDTNDPQKRGRIRVLCPKVIGEGKSNWCNPCIPVAYDFGGDFAVPKVGETVWIEFEAGDVNKPIYVGNWWSENKSPSDPYDVHTRNIIWDKCKIAMVGSKSENKPERLEVSVGNSLIKVEEDKITISVGGSSITLTPADITEIAGTIKLN